MVAVAGMPLSRTTVLWKIAFCDRKALPSVWNCGRMSSMLAMKVPPSLLTRLSRAWRSKFTQMRVPTTRQVRKYYRRRPPPTLWFGNLLHIAY